MSYIDRRLYIISNIVRRFYISVFWLFNANDPHNIYIYMSGNYLYESTCIY